MLNLDDRLIKEVSPKIGPNALSVLLAIAIHLNQKTNRCFPSHARLMELTGMGKNAVYDAMKVLKAAELLKVEQAIDTKKKQFGRRVFRLSTRFIKIFVDAEDVEPLPENREPENREPENREPENREPENRETYQLNNLEQINQLEQINNWDEGAREKTEAVKAEKAPNPSSAAPLSPSWNDRPNTDTPAKMVADLRAFYATHLDDFRVMCDTARVRYSYEDMTEIIAAFCGHRIENNRTADTYRQIHGALQKWLIGEKTMRKKPAAAIAPAEIQYKKKPMMY